MLVRGSQHVARQALVSSQLAPFVRHVLVNGASGILVAPRGKVQVVMAFTVIGGQIVAIDVLADPSRLDRFERPSTEG